MEIKCDQKYITKPTR